MPKLLRVVSEAFSRTTLRKNSRVLASVDFVTVAGRPQNIVPTEVIVRVVGQCE